MRKALPLVAIVLAGVGFQPSVASPNSWTGLAGSVSFTKVDCVVNGLTERIRPVFTSPDSIFDYCVYPSSFIRTDSGGRAEFVLGSRIGIRQTMGAPVTYGSYSVEANCRTMESRQKYNWSIQRYPLDYNRSYLSYSKPYDVWVGTHFAGTWRAWEPVEGLAFMPRVQWLCTQWREGG